MAFPAWVTQEKPRPDGGAETHKNTDKNKPEQSACGSVAQSCLPCLSASGAVAYQAPLSMGFSRKEYLSWLPFPSPGDQIQVSCIVGRFFTAWATKEALEQSSLFCFYNGNNYAFHTSTLLLWRENNKIFFNSKCQRIHARNYLF